MKSGVIRTITLVFLAALTLSLINASMASAEEAVGKVTRAQGTASAIRGGRTLKISIGFRVMRGDLIQTQVNSRVRMLMSDSTILSVGPKSQMRIKSFSHNAGARQTAADYALVYGRGRAKVPTTPGARNINFSTPSAVAGVRGTELIFEYDPATGQTRIVVVDGTVTIANPNDPTQFITLGPGMGCIVGANGVPGSPFQVPIEEIQQLLNSVGSKDDSPRRVVVIEIPGTGGSDLNNSVSNLGGGEGVLIIDETGAIVNPEDLIDQEPPPLTPVIINIDIGGGAVIGL